ncbi:GC-rich sequence DNA-binding factor-like protein-domain-containing protein [Globomyces pollinis-pini]|nr:GC-rich sequence DNA-binding factor-like protein-domain-containing protein [Globomyces pollinis-pini]
MYSSDDDQNYHNSNNQINSSDDDHTTRNQINFIKSQSISSDSDSSDDEPTFIPIKRNKDQEEEELNNDLQSFSNRFSNTNHIPNVDLKESKTNIKMNLENQVFNQVPINTPHNFPQNNPKIFSKSSKIYSNDKSKKSKFNPIGSVNQNPVLPSKDFAQFEKHSKGIGSKLLMKMGYKPGQGLGKDGSGISTPIDVKLRPTKMGLGHGGFDERTEAVKKEYEEKSEQLEAEKFGPKQRWKKKGIKQRKPRYLTADQLIMEINAQTVPTQAQPISTKIRDLTGREEKILSNISELNQPDEYDTTERFPELRHNVKIIAESSKTDLSQLARQIKIEESKVDHDTQLIQSLHQSIQQDKLNLSRLSKVKFSKLICQVKEILNETQQIYKSNQTELLSKDLNIQRVSDLFAPCFNKLVTEYQPEYQQYQLDYHLISVLSPIFQNLLREWDPLQQPLYCMDLLRNWTGLLAYHAPETHTAEMTAFETMLANIWLPKLRQSINNDWNPEQPDSIIQLIDQWDKSKLLPPWLFHNIVSQLIIPKLEGRLETWDFKDGYHIHTWLFPWLPILGERMDDLWVTTRQLLQSYLTKNWTPDDPIGLKIVSCWADVFGEYELQLLLTRSILPKLIEHLQTNFKINPASQDLQPLLDTFQWSEIIPTHLFSHLIETQFFEPWKQILWTWITSPQSNLDEITQWYQSWKQIFINYKLQNLTSVKDGFRIGLDMMNQGMTNPTQFIPSTTQPTITKPIQATIGDMTFKDLVETLCGEHDVEFVPLLKRHENGKELYRIGKLNVYIDDGLLFVQTKGSYRFMSIDDAIDLAKQSL